MTTVRGQRRLAFACTLVAALAVPVSAAAQPSDSALAAQLFIDGQKLMTAGKTAEACPKLAESHRLDPKLGTLLNLASCHEQDGQLTAAWSEFTDALTLAERAKRTDRVDFAKTRIAALEKKLARVRIANPGDPATAVDVRLDGKALSTAALGSALPVDPGKHVIEASARGKKSWSTTIEAAAGGETSVTVPALEDESASSTPPPAPPPPPPKAPPKEEPTSSLRNIGYLVAGVGLAGMAVGGVFGVLAFTKEADAEKACPTTECETQAGVDQHDAARMSALVSTIAFAAGSALVVTGGILILASPKATATARATTLRLNPQGIVFGGSF